MNSRVIIIRNYPQSYFFLSSHHFGLQQQQQQLQQQQTVQPDCAQESRADPTEVRGEAVLLQGRARREHHAHRQSHRKPDSKSNLAQGIPTNYCYK